MTLTEIKAYLQHDAFPYYMDREDESSRDLQDDAYRALLHTLTIEDLKHLIGWLETCDGCPMTLLYKASGILKSKLKATMAEVPTSTLLKLYSDKKSGKVCSSTKALKDRFFHEDAESKRAILKAFLRGGKKEVEWAARYLRDHWTKSMTTLVGYIWKKTQNPVLAQVVIRHLPESFVLAEQEKLADAIGYTYVCARLGKRKDFIIDASRLTTLDYLYVLAKSGTGRSDLSVIEARLEEYLSGSGWITPREAGLILWALGRLGLAETIIRTKPRLEERLRESALITGDGPKILDRD